MPSAPAPPPFELHPRLAADCAPVGDLPLCRLLLMNDRRFPWTILVPRRPDLRELHDLGRDDRGALFDEIEAVSRALLAVTAVAKLNVGALGNLVPQLHVHVVGREPGDAAWPGPVWGAGTAQSWPSRDLQSLLAALRDELNLPQR